jgi:hypothetical protein
MIKHAKKVLVGVGALAALAFGGATLAQAGQQPVKPTVEPASAPDRDTVQSGDQTTPDTPAAPAAKASKAPSTAKSAAAEAPGTETPDGSSGSADPGGSAAGSETPDTGGETPGSETPNNDGPGGHADEPGNANADHQASGQE